jgi:glyoxalase/bleomycin resistance protein/dioxygenase superfamily protein
VSGPVLTFQLEAISLEEAAEDLKSNGIEFPAGFSEHDWGRVATFKDPDGNDLQRYVPPKSYTSNDSLRESYQTQARSRRPRSTLRAAHQRYSGIHKR